MDSIQIRNKQLQSRRLRDQFIEAPYAFPGGYPLATLMDDGGTLCVKCCKEESKLIGSTTGSDGWCIEALFINYEDDECYCDHCGSKIEVAYS